MLCPFASLKHAGLRPSRAVGRPQARPHRLRALPEAVPGQTVLGFAGLGIMGKPMARNLINAGFQLVVWNRTPSACEPLQQLGAQVAATPSDLAAAADYTFAMLADDAAALSVVTGPDGILEGIKGKAYIDMSTLSEPTAAEIAYEVTQAGGHCLEAPVSGSKAPAEQGQLIFMTSGSEELYSAVHRPLDAMGKARFYLGDVGSATRMKLVVNLVMGSMMGALAEGVHLAERSALSPAQLIEILSLGAMASPLVANKGPSMLAGNFGPAFPYKHQLKDLNYALEMADDSDVDLRIARATRDLYESATAELADKDFSAVLQAARGASDASNERTAK